MKIQAIFGGGLIPKVRLLVAGLIISFSSFALHAATISGQVEVLKKNGKETLGSSEYAVVYLTGVGKPLITAAPTQEIVINQKEKQFMPRVMPIVKGQMVHFYNQDEIDHNVFSTEEKKSFDLGRYPKGDFRPVQYDQTGDFKVYCNIHQTMVLDIMVLENSYFAVTDEEGNYQIDNAPEGNYQLNVWHIFGGTAAQPIALSKNPLVLPKIQIVNTKVVRDIEKHVDKNGRTYKKNGRYRH